MTRRPARVTQAEIARACRAAPNRVVEVTLPDGTVIRLVPSGLFQDESKARNATGYVEARLADAPWAKSK
jgi:hypothetical protein